jgi:hypothetical protein
MRLLPDLIPPAPLCAQVPSPCPALRRAPVERQQPRHDLLIGEIAALPDIGPALAALLLVGAGLEGEALTGGIGLGGHGVAEQAAKVDEVLLGGAALLEGGLAPLGNEGLGSKGRWHEGNCSFAAIIGGCIV